MEEATADAGAMPRFNSFAEFFPFYLQEHSNPVNRWLHFVGTSLGTAMVPAAIALGNPWLLLAYPVLGYGFAWFGHFVIEKNKPASFKHPLWSFIGDYKMYGLMLSGKI